MVFAFGCQNDIQDENPQENVDAATDSDLDDQNPSDPEDTAVGDRDTSVPLDSDTGELDTSDRSDLDSDVTPRDTDTDTSTISSTDSEEPEVDTGRDGGNPEPSEGDPSMVIDATLETEFIPIKADQPVFINALAVDAAGEIVVGGNTWGDLYSKNNFYGTNDGVWARFDAKGTFLGGMQFGTRAMDIVNGVLSDNAGNTYLTGRTAGEMQTHFGMEDFFVTKVDSNDLRQWTGQFGITDPGSDFSIYEDIAYASAINTKGSIYMAGTTDSLGSADGLVVKFNGRGRLVWDKIADTEALSMDIWAITVTPREQIFITGMVGYSGSSGLDFDLFVAGIDGASKKQFFYREWGVEDASDYGKAIVTDAKGNIYVVGQSEGELVLIVLDANQNQKTFKRYSLGSSWIEPRALALDDSENILVAGTMAENESNQGMTDLFVMKIENDRAFKVEWQLSGGTELDDMVNDIAIDKNGTVYAAGSYNWDLFDPRKLSSNGFLLLIKQ